MALMKKSYADMPKDAIMLSEDEALKYQFKLIQNWKKTSDTWVFRHGFSILALMSAVSSAYINNHYRIKFRLFAYGRVASYLPVVILPSLVSGMYHQEFVVTDILLQKTRCPACLEVRAATFQSVLSTVFPTVLAPLAALSFATRYNTYNVPSITQEPKKVFQMLYRHTRPITSALVGIMAIQGLVASLLTYQEAKSIIRIHMKLNELEAKLEAEHNIDT